MIVNYNVYNETLLSYEYKNSRFFSLMKSSLDFFNVFTRFSLININIMNSFKLYNFLNFFNYFNLINSIIEMKIKIINTFYKKELKLNKRSYIKKESF